MAVLHADWAASAEAELADLERIWETLDIPDLMIAPKDAPGFGDNELLRQGVLFVAEVVSPHSKSWDRVAKPRAYAQGRVPLYLLIDQLADPATVTLFSDPGEGSYQSCQPVTAGQPLRLPAPFGIALDTGRLLG
jgi:hypothetical protein